MTKDGGFKVDMEDEVVRGATVVHGGKVTWPPPKPKNPPLQDATAKPKPAPAVAETKKADSPANRMTQITTFMVIAGGLLALLGAVAPADFLSHFTVFVLACFVGWQIIWNVTPALHTPLMSVTNAISGIIVIGAMVQVAGPVTGLATILSAIAILIATINVAGGFMVTQRMLKMFHK